MFDNCANGRICRSPINIMPVRLCCCCRGLYDHRKQLVPIGLYVRRYSDKLFGQQPRRFVHNVRTGEHYIQRQHRLIRIRPGLRHGITHPGLRPPLRRGKLATYRCGAKFPSTEGCRRIGPRENAIFVGDKSTGWSESPKKTRLLPFVITSNKKHCGRMPTAFGVTINKKRGIAPFFILQPVFLRLVFPQIFLLTFLFRPLGLRQQVLLRQPFWCRTSKLYPQPTRQFHLVFVQHRF